MPGVGPHAPLRLDSEKRVQPLEYRQDAAHVRGLTRMNDVDVERVHRGATENGGHSSDDDEIHSGLGQHAKQRYGPMLLHSARESPGYRLRAVPAPAGARRG